MKAQRLLVDGFQTSHSCLAQTGNPTVASAAASTLPTITNNNLEVHSDWISVFHKGMEGRSEKINLTFLRFCCLKKDIVSVSGTMLQDLNLFLFLVTSVLKKTEFQACSVLSFTSECVKLKLFWL